MLSLKYSEYDMLAIFRAANPGKVNPTANEIAEFDQDLFDTINDILLEILPEEGLPTTKSIRSTILLYSRSGAGNVRQKVRTACQFFRNTSGA